MPKPVENGWYTVVNGDTLHTIERQAYGRIVNRVAAANNDLLQSRGISDEGLPILYAGDKLFIPLYKNRYDNQPITADFDTQLRIDLDGITLNGASASRITRQMNTIASGFVFDVPFDYHDKKMVDLLRPYKWQKAQLWVGTDLYITALACKWDFDDAAGKATIEVRTMPGEMIECMGMRKSYVFKAGSTLLDICQEVAAPYGITCYASDGTGGTVTDTKKKRSDNSVTSYKYGADGKPVQVDGIATATMQRVEQDINETDADFLQRIAIQKGFLVTSRSDGNLLLTRANVKDKPSCALVSGVYPVLHASSSHDGSKRFSKWMAYTEEDGTPGQHYEARDTTVNRLRSFTFKATDAEEGNLKTAVNWRMAKSIAESHGVNVQVAGWRNVNGEMWNENMKVTGLFPGAYVFTESEFIIESVDLTKDDSGDIADMRLVIPESYTTTTPKSPFPWDGYYTERV